GLKASWKLFDYGNAKREKSIYAANQAIVNTKKEYLEDNIDIQLTKEYAEVNKLKELLEKDKEIIDLQSEIVESAFSQVRNGVITSTNYLSELNTKTQLELTRQIHLVQLKQTEYNCLNISGNL
ncbi:MAG: TolC family protein, partial [Cyclobacteriaceae bacterium]|nr:TolC family protein [Cyclobacteriaceae bacterium]